MGLASYLFLITSLGIIASLKPPAYLKCMLSPSILPCGGQVEDLQVAGPRSEISHLILSLQRYYCIIFWWFQYPCRWPCQCPGLSVSWPLLSTLAPFSLPGLSGRKQVAVKSVFCLLHTWSLAVKCNHEAWCHPIHDNWSRLLGLPAPPYYFSKSHSPYNYTYILPSLNLPVTFFLLTLNDELCS